MALLKVTDPSLKQKSEIVKLCQEMLLYSPLKGSVLCFTCNFFGNSDVCNDNNEWKKAAMHLAKHKGYEKHNTSMIEFYKAKICYGSALQNNYFYILALL